MIFKNSGSGKILIEFQLSSSLVFLAVGRQVKGSLIFDFSSAFDSQLTKTIKQIKKS